MYYENFDIIIIIIWALDQDKIADSDLVMLLPRQYLGFHNTGSGTIMQINQKIFPSFSKISENFVFIFIPDQSKFEFDKF